MKQLMAGGGVALIGTTLALHSLEMKRIPWFKIWHSNL